jgi:preprotein translocase subunit Sss1
MAEPVYISVNLPNIITITLIGAVGFAIFAAIAAFVMRNNPLGGA